MTNLENKTMSRRQAARLIGLGLIATAGCAVPTPRPSKRDMLMHRTPNNPKGFEKGHVDHTDSPHVLEKIKLHGEEMWVTTNTHPQSDELNLMFILDHDYSRLRDNQEKETTILGENYLIPTRMREADGDLVTKFPFEYTGKFALSARVHEPKIDEEDGSVVLTENSVTYRIGTRKINGAWFYAPKVKDLTTYFDVKRQIAEGNTPDKGHFRLIPVKGTKIETKPVKGLRDMAQIILHSNQGVYELLKVDGQEYRETQRPINDRDLRQISRNQWYDSSRKLVFEGANMRAVQKDVTMVFPGPVSSR